MRLIWWSDSPHEVVARVGIAPPSQIGAPRSSSGMSCKDFRGGGMPAPHHALSRCWFAVCTRLRPSRSDPDRLDPRRGEGRAAAPLISGLAWLREGGGARFGVGRWGRAGMGSGRGLRAVAGFGHHARIVGHVLDPTIGDQQYAGDEQIARNRQPGGDESEGDRGEASGQRPLGFGVAAAIAGDEAPLQGEIADRAGPVSRQTLNVPLANHDTRSRDRFVLRDADATPRRSLMPRAGRGSRRAGEGGCGALAAWGGCLLSRGACRVCGIRTN